MKTPEMTSAAPKPLISRYRLKARGLLNSISRRREFEGVLIQIDGGFGCIHPWPELGDPAVGKMPGGSGGRAPLADCETGDAVRGV